MSSKSQVGRGKPPIKNQFAKGQSGNPAGRPKGSRGLKQIMRDELERAITVGSEGRKSELSALAVITRMMANKAMQGDAKIGFSLLQLSCALDSAITMPDRPDEIAPDDAALIEGFVARQEKKRGGHE